MESPHLSFLHEKYAGRGLSILAVNVSEPPRETRKTIEKFIDTYAVRYPVIPDGREVFKTTYEGKSIPHTYLLDQKGRIVWVQTDWNAEAATELESRIKKLL